MITPGLLNLTMTIGCTFESFKMVFLDVNGDPVNLTGYSVYSEVRHVSGDTVILNLAPTISNAAGGEITFPKVEETVTATFSPDVHQWDVLLKDTTPDIQRLVFGQFTIQTKITLS